MYRGRYRPKHADPRSAGYPRRMFLAVALVIVWALGLVGGITFASAVWIKRVFGRVSVEQALMNLQGAGAESGGTDLFTQGFLWGIGVPLLVWLALLLTWTVSRMKSRPPAPAGRLHTVLPISLVSLLALAPIAGIVASADTFKLRDYARARYSSSNLADYYVEPMWSLPREADKAPYNLIVLYLESVEDSMGDAELFEHNMLASLQDATQGWLSIPDFGQYSGGGWTMAGIVSTQCGLPYRSPPGARPDDVGMGVWAEKHGEVLPNATCLGDVLKQAGYSTLHLGGARTDMSGKDLFLYSHGYDEAIGRAEWEEAGETELRDDWGLSDRRLFDNAEEIVRKLRDSADPFFLSVLTLDTHEIAHVHDYCNVTTSVPMESVYRCSIDQVAKFVTFLDRVGILDDTVVVIMGDHVKMPGPQANMMKELQSVPDRTLFNRIWIPGIANRSLVSVDQVSMYATMLEALGFELADGRAGVGVSALRENVNPGTIRDLEPEELADLEESHSPEFYRHIWGYG